MWESEEASWIESDWGPPGCREVYSLLLKLLSLSLYSIPPPSPGDAFRQYWYILSTTNYISVSYYHQSRPVAPHPGVWIHF